MDKTDITFRHLQREADYELMHSILMASTKADRIIETASVDEIKRWCAPTRRFDPKNGILFALGEGKEKEYTEIGFSRISWYTGKDGAQLYCQMSYLVPEHRKQGVWSEIARA